jgi:phosphonate transport system substrate-binding protein
MTGRRRVLWRNMNGRCAPAGARGRLPALAWIAAAVSLLLQLTVHTAAGTALPQYRFGVTPWQHGQSNDDIRELYKPLLEWLGRKVEAEFIIVGAGGYGEMIDLLANESIDLGAVSPVPFVLAKQRNPRVTMLATELSWNFGDSRKGPSYESFIIARADREDITGLESLRAARLGLVRKQSTSGYVYPVAYFIRNGIDYKTFFSRVYFLGSQPRVTDAIASGSIDAGATWDYNLKQAINKHGPIFKIVARTGTIPNLGIAANSSVPETMQARIRSALLEADESLFRGLPAAGYVLKEDSYYDPVRDVVQLVSGAPGMIGEEK